MNDSDWLIYKILMGVIILAHIYLGLISLTEKYGKDRFRIYPSFDRQGNTIYAIHFYSVYGSGRGRDWSTRSWRRIDFHDYYTREEAEKVMRERGYRK